MGFRWQLSFDKSAVTPQRRPIGRNVFHITGDQIHYKPGKRAINEVQCEAQFLAAAASIFPFEFALLGRAGTSRKQAVRADDEKKKRNSRLTIFLSDRDQLQPESTRLRSASRWHRHCDLSTRVSLVRHEIANLEDRNHPAQLK